MLEIIETQLASGLAAAALMTLRLFLTPLLAYNALWSFQGFRELLKGDSYPISLYQSVIFMFSLAVLGYNGLAFFGRAVSNWSLPWSLTFQCMILLGSLAAFVGRRTAISVNFQRFYWLFRSNNLDIAVRVAELNEADPEFTRSVVETAETTIAIKLARRAIDERAN